MKKTTRQSGQEWECLAKKKLEEEGYRVLAMNYSCRYGEIDIVGIEDSCLCFVEVKARTSKIFGEPYEAVNQKKLDKIAKTGEDFRNKWKKKLPMASRIDVVSMMGVSGEISIEIMKNVTG